MQDKIKREKQAIPHCAEKVSTFEVVQRVNEKTTPPIVHGTRQKKNRRNAQLLRSGTGAKTKGHKTKPSLEVRGGMENITEEESTGQTEVGHRVREDWRQHRP